MHCVPLRYHRTTKPKDTATFVRIESMTGENEQRCTYPSVTSSFRSKSAGPNRDRPKDKVPPPTRLEVVELAGR